MRNNKGFTMVELLVVVVILGVIATIAIAGIRGVLNRTKESYLDNQNKMVVLAGKTYYSDHRSKLPKVIGPIHEVSLQTLIDLKYIDPVKDANGKECVISDEGKESKVYVQKVSEEEYKYNGYLYCNGEESGISDTVKPVVTLTPNKLTTIQTKPVTVTLKVTDNEGVLSYRYIIYKEGKEFYDTGYKNYKKKVEIKLTENGSYTIKAYAYDTSGNRGETEGGVYRLQIPQPNCNGFKITSNPNSTDWQKKDIKITVRSTDTNTESWTLKDKHYDNKTKKTKTSVLIKRTTSGQKTYTLSDNGEHSIIVEGYNSVGGHCTKTLNTYKVDKEKPTTPKITGNPGKWVNYNFSLNVSTKEEYSGIKHWQYSYDARSWTTYANSAKTTFTTTPFSAERNQYVYIRTEDVAGNISSASSSRIQIDKTPPTIRFTTSPGPHNSNSGINVYATCTDNRGGSGVKTLPGNGAHVGSPTTGTVRTIGCYDNAGNYNSVSQSFSVKYYSRNSVCGVELYNYRRSAACGVERYNYRKSSACGAATCSRCPQRKSRTDTYYCVNSGNSTGNCCGTGWVPAGGSKDGKSRLCKKTVSWTEYTATCTSSTYCGWRGCRHSSHGVELYNGCRHPNHGVELYRNCWHF